MGRSPFFLVLGFLEWSREALLEHLEPSLPAHDDPLARGGGSLGALEGFLLESIDLILGAPGEP